MDVIEQKLVVKDWPLKKPGDEKFFGYLVALGVFPREWSELDLYLFADFSYGDEYSRYRLPHDRNLLKQLREYLVTNLETMDQIGDIYGKVWITLTEEGHKVYLP